MMMKTTFITLALLAASALPINARERVKLDMGKNFTSINSSAPVDIYLCNKADSAGYVVYDIEPEVKDYLKIGCTEKTLTVDMMKADRHIKDFYKKAGVVKVYVPLPLEAITVTGAGDIDAMAGIAASENLGINISGAGDIELEQIATVKLSVAVSGAGDVDMKDVTAAETDITISGAGDIRTKRLTSKSADVNIIGAGDVSMDGTCKSVHLNVSGSGDISCRKLKADIVTVKVSGSGDISCYASEMATATCSGSGEIKIYGEPATTKLVGRKENINLIK